MLISSEEAEFVECRVVEGFSSSAQGNVGIYINLGGYLFFRHSISYIEKRNENFHLSCFTSVTEEKNMP